MNNKIVALLVFTFFLCFHLNAQVNQEKAYQAFKKASTAFQNDNYQESAIHLREVKTLLGTTNIRIQPMYIKSLVGIEDWRQAKKEFGLYYGLNPDTEYVEYGEMVALEKEIDTKIEEEERLFANVKRSKSLTQYQLYLSTFPYGNHREEVQQLIVLRKDDLAWENAERSGTMDSYYAYLEEYNGGIHDSEARTKINNVDKQAYTKAISEGTQSSLNYYLDNYTRGTYRSMVRKKLIERRDFDAYRNAKRQNKVTAFESYIRRYPKGKYAKEIHLILGKLYYDEGNKAFSSKNYTRAAENFEKYVSSYPNGTYILETSRSLKKSRKLARQYDHTGVVFTYDDSKALGTSFTSLNRDKVGVFVNLKSSYSFGPSYVYTTDDVGNHDSPYTLIGKTGEKVKRIVIALMVAPTFKIAYPLWGYVGGGVGYYSGFEKVEYMRSSGAEDKAWFRNTDQNRLQAFPAAGIILPVGENSGISYGISYNEKLIHQFGFAYLF